MPCNLEDRLERVADTLPGPSSASRDRARRAALRALPSTRQRRRWRVGILVPAVAVAVAAVAIVAAPWREGPLATERALAVLGPAPVVHAIVEQSTWRQIVIDLASGRTRVERSRAEYWYDDQLDVLRVQLSVAGKLLPGGEYLHSNEGFFTDRGLQPAEGRRPQVDPALEGFASGYRAALESGRATVVGEEVVDGQQAVVLRFRSRATSSDEVSQDVAVAADDYRPLRFRLSSTAASGGVIPWSQAPRIIKIEAIARDPADFQPPEPGEPRPAKHTGTDEQRLKPAEAPSAFGHPVLWPGEAVGGIPLTQIELVRLTTQWTNGRVTEGRALLFQYGADRRAGQLEREPSLIVIEGSSPEEVFGFNLGGPMLRDGELRLAGVGSGDGGDAEMWFGAMQRDGVYISFESPQRDMIIGAAKAMVRLG